MLHQSIHAITLFLNPTYAYSCDFDFNCKVVEGLLTCLWRMVPDGDAHRTINHKMEMYWEASELFGFVDVVNERSILMLHKPLEFKILTMFYLKVEICFPYFLFSIIMKWNFSLLFVFVIDAWWRNYRANAPNTQKFPIEVLSESCSTSRGDTIGVCFKKYTQRSTTGWNFN